jgi:chloramphenicol-sensitive protein RarD
MVGFMQYLTPTIQFILALTFFHEEMPLVRWFGFGLVWLGLAALSFDVLRKKGSKSPN